MPGRRLSHDEERLVQFWTEPPAAFSGPLLKGVTIEGPPALRGIERLRVPFDYPITAICGRNGVGKSTILALTAFSARRPQNWTVAPWPTAPTRRQPARTAYAWNDFFFRHTDDPPYDGLNIRFSYSLAGNDVDIERRWVNGRWRTSPDPGRSRPRSFPVRAIEFVSLARILPPGELHHVRRFFGEAHPTTEFALDKDMHDAMSAIFRRTYTNVRVHEAGGVSLARCSAGTDYSGFDMGAGENAMITILSKLQRLPLGGLLIVEEIEHGLHPEAQRHLVDALTGIVWKKKQQVIFTTHSSHVIDRLPRCGRILLENVGADHRTVPSPTTRLALSNMTGLAEPEATLYVEDNFASSLIFHCLPRDLRKRVNIVPIGDSSRVAAQLGAHMRGKYPGPAKCVFDGDCSQADIGGWMRREGLEADESTFMCLPGDGQPPESWVLQALQVEPYISKFADRIDCAPGEAAEEIVRLLALPDHHDVPHELASRIGFSDKEAVSALASAIASTHTDLNELRDAVQAMVN